MKRLISLFLAICLSFATVPMAFASESPITVPGLTVSSDAEISSAMDEENVYYFIYDWENGTAQAVVENRQTGELFYCPVVGFDSISADDDETTNVPSRSSSPTYHQDTFSNFEYDIWEGVIDSDWLLQRPRDEFRQYEFMTFEDSDNRSELVNFRRCVDSLNDQELYVIAVVGDFVLKSIVAGMTSAAAYSTYGVLSPAAVTALLEAYDASDPAFESLHYLADLYNSCAYAYFDALEVSNPYDGNEPNYF